MIQANELRIGNYDYYCPNFKMCNSVHQLQNLYFALTGKELNVNYNK